MARKPDTRTSAKRPAAKSAPKSAPRSAAKRAPKSSPGKSGAGKTVRAAKAPDDKAKTARSPRGTRSASRAAVSMASLEAVRTPVALVSTKTKKKVKSETKKALKAVKKARKGSRKSMPEFLASSSPLHLSDTFKSVGNQIAGALNTDVGRVMVAELLVYVAKSLTRAASKTDAAKDTKSALISAGAKIGAAAADAGARMVETGQAAVARGAKALDRGKDAVANGAGDDARTMVQHVADAAVSAVGGAVAEAAANLMGSPRRRGPGRARATTSVASTAEAAVKAVRGAARRKRAAPPEAGSETPTAARRGRPPKAADVETGAAPAIQADAGHKPQDI